MEVVLINLMGRPNILETPRRHFLCDNYRGDIPESYRISKRLLLLPVGLSKGALGGGGGGGEGDGGCTLMITLLTGYKFDS